MMIVALVGFLSSFLFFVVFFCCVFLGSMVEMQCARDERETKVLK
jgi:hypothetical protein